MEIIQTDLNKISPYIIAIYNENYNFIGNGLIITDSNKQFFLSCKHVLEEYQSE